MTNKQDSIHRTLLIALLLSIVTSIVVSGTAILLKPIQTFNKMLDKQRSILTISGLANDQMSNKEIKKLFKNNIIQKVVDLKKGTFSDKFDPIYLNSIKVDQHKELSKSLNPKQDIALIKRIERYIPVYIIKKNNTLETLILPIRGYGLWSTLYGFIALKKDLNMISGFGFYQHGETPGLGGEIDNKTWKAMWVGKHLYTKEGTLAIQIIKGVVNKNNHLSIHQVEGLAGATLTSRGVHNLLHFWLGKDGFNLFLKNLREGKA